MLSVINDFIDPNVTIGIGAKTDIDKIKSVIKDVNFCSVKVFDDSSKIISSLKKGEIDAIVRGTLQSSEFLKEIKINFNIDKIYRIGLLGTYDKKYFFFAPLGIDEGETLEEKEIFIKYAKDLLKKFRFDPKISVLSGGRIKDLGRSETVDKSINEAQILTERHKINNAEILIEEAVKDSNFILAPNGVSGNLIYRTLIHLGCGTSHGALYYPLAIEDTIIVDTSSAAPKEEYISSIALANALKSY